MREETRARALQRVERSLRPIAALSQVIAKLHAPMRAVQPLRASMRALLQLRADIPLLADLLIVAGDRPDRERLAAARRVLDRFPGDGVHPLHQRQVREALAGRYTDHALTAAFLAWEVAAEVPVGPGMEQTLAAKVRSRLDRELSEEAGRTRRLELDTVPLEDHDAPVPTRLLEELEREDRVRELLAVATPAERELAEAIATGAPTIAAAAERLGIAPGTARERLSSLRRRVLAAT